MLKKESQGMDLTITRFSPVFLFFYVFLTFFFVGSWPSFQSIVVP